MTLVHIDKNKDALRKHEELWKEIKGLIRSMNNNSDDYDEKYMKIKFSLDDDLRLKKRLELRNIIIIVRFVFYDGWQQILSTSFFRWMFV